MKLSLIVPVYNVSDFLEECLRSAIDEADKDVEIVCVDDGSTDSSGDMLDRFARSPTPGGCVVKVIHQKNAGAGEARNAALRVATGDWILFLDGDDLLAKGWLAVVRTLASRHPSAQMLGFGRTETLPVRPVEVRESREVDVSRVVGFDVYERGLWQYAYRRDLVAGLEFERIIRVEDKLFEGDALLRASRVALMDVPAYGYRQREGSVIHTNWNRANFSAELIWRIKWLKAMTAAGKTMDRKIWRFMGLCLLEYIPRHLQDVSDKALHDELESAWFDTLRQASQFDFAPWQRFAMRVLGVTRSRFAAWFFCRLPFALKQAMHRYRVAPARRRVLFCGVGFGHGGLASSFPQIAATLERAGYEVKVLVPHAADAGRLDVPVEYEVGPAFRWRIGGLWIGRAIRLFHLLTFGAFRFVLAKQVPHDVFVVYGASCCMEWCGYSKKPTWAFLHSAPMTGPSAALRPLILRDMRRSAAHCRGMFAVSETMKRAWDEVGIKSDVLRLPYSDELLRGVAEAPRDTKRCVCVGRLSHEKGQDRLLDALARVPGVRLSLVGDGPDRDSLVSRAEALGISDRVEFAGWQKDVTPFLSNAGLVVNSSRSEALGLSTIEALLSGAPVLATDIPGNREALSNGRYGRLVPDSVEGLASGLAAFAADPHVCDPDVGFAVVREELRAISLASTERLGSIDWMGGT